MEREDMDSMVAASEWKGYWESLINENTDLRARVARLESLTRTYLLALELYLPSAVSVIGSSEQAGVLRSAEKDLRRALGEK